VKRVLALLLVAGALMAPLAAAAPQTQPILDPIAETPLNVVCTTVIVGKLQETTCRGGGSCDGINVIVAHPGACRDPKGPGCTGVTVIIDSPQSCFGGPGKPGCVGTTIIDPTSPGSCVGGPGKKVLDLIATLTGDEAPQLPTVIALEDASQLTL
jgi:hypothetical protein